MLLREVQLLSKEASFESVEEAGRSDSNFQSTYVSRSSVVSFRNQTSDAWGGANKLHDGGHLEMLHQFNVHYDFITTASGRELHPGAKPCTPRDPLKLRVPSIHIPSYHPLILDVYRVMDSHPTMSPPTLCTLGGEITSEEAVGEESNMRQQLSYRQK